MLKIDLFILFALSLLVESEWSKLISCVLAFIAPLSLYMAGELKKNKLTGRALLIRVMTAFGVTVGGLLFKDIVFKDPNVPLIIFGCTFLCETIAVVARQVGDKAVTTFINNAAGTSQDKKDSNE